jgi:Rps23 Pro-64 3,4-dihydroxylase Tpa1-like proline 4-hydroxylase
MNTTQTQTNKTLSSLGMFDSPRYAQLAVSNATRYQTAEPFPHIAIDNFIDDDLADQIIQAFPVPEGDAGWVVRDNKNNRRKFQTDETLMSRPLREVLREFNSRQFLLFLETLTGIDNLLPDPYFIGGGIHISGAGDFLNVHADFNWHHKLQAHRRVNALLYLNRGWKEEWNGALELWDRDMKQAIDVIYPQFNRLVVFNVTDYSHHGQPKPNACPPNEYRKVLNLYFYTTQRDAAEITDPHFTVYKTEASPNAVELGTNYRNSAAPAEVTT